MREELQLQLQEKADADERVQKQLKAFERKLVTITWV